MRRRVLFAFLVVGALSLGGCYLENRESMREAPRQANVMDDLQATADQQAVDPLAVSP